MCLCILKVTNHLILIKKIPLKSIWLEFHVQCWCCGFTAFLAKSKYGCQKSHFLRWFIVLLCSPKRFSPLMHSSKIVQKCAQFHKLSVKQSKINFRQLIWIFKNSVHGASFMDDFSLRFTKENPTDWIALQLETKIQKKKIH